MQSEFQSDRPLFQHWEPLFGHLSPFGGRVDILPLVRWLPLGMPLPLFPPAMSFLITKTLSPSPLLPPNQHRNNSNRKPRTNNPRHHHCSLQESPQTLTLESKKEIERGLEFETGDSFFRHESAIGRDLGVLAASLYKKSKGNIRILDAMCGCGVRSLRYLVEAEADFVWANDANEEYRGTILSNFTRNVKVKEGERRWVITHSDANRVMAECYLQRDFFDLIDIDSFGSNSTFFRSAYDSLKLDGLLYVTSTDGYSSGGHRPHHSLASYGAYVRPMPYSNEVGLRMLIGGAVRDASVLGYHVSPLFSYYSYHGPVFRVMLRVNRGKLPENKHYGFISYCTKCGNSQAFLWDQLGKICCLCNDGEVSRSPVVSGPLWTGPLHDTTYVTEMLNLAEQWRWARTGTDTSTDLEKLLETMIDESDPKLPFGYIKLDQVAKRAKINSPPLRTMMSALKMEGYAASRSHIASNALKTNCPMTQCIRIARELQQP